MAPSHELFRKCGIFLRPQFADRSTCEALCAEMRGAAGHPAEVYGAKTDVNPAARTAWEVSLGSRVADDLAARIAGMLPELADHFGAPLARGDDPSFLRYSAGGFHRPHRDRTASTAYAPHASKAGLKSRATAPDAHDRRVSVSLLLNDGYTGGALTFYGLIDDPPWRDLGFALPAEPGLLVGFSSDLLHEVTPVLSGERYSVVTWFR